MVIAVPGVNAPKAETERKSQEIPPIHNTQARAAGPTVIPTLTWLPLSPVLVGIPPEQASQARPGQVDWSLRSASCAVQQFLNSRTTRNSKKCYPSPPNACSDNGMYYLPHVTCKQRKRAQAFFFFFCQAFGAGIPRALKQGRHGGSHVIGRMFQTLRDPSSLVFQHPLLVVQESSCWHIVGQNPSSMISRP